MNPGTALLWSALILGLISVISSIIHKKKDEEKLKTLSVFTYIGSIITISFSFLLLLYYFVVSDFTIHYVWEHSSRDLSLLYRTTAVWSGMEGSIFLWAFLTAAVLAAAELINHLKKNKTGYDPSHFDYVRISVQAIILLFLVGILVNDPFQTSQSYFDEIASGEPVDFDPDSEGVGLKPSLRSPWMFSHPPLIFIAYGAIVVIFGASLSSLFTKGREWVETSVTWSKISWIFLTIGIGIGAVWAYRTTGWGGYWSWDPKETSALIIWIGLSTLIFVQNKYRYQKVYDVLTPALGISVFALMLLGTFITRSGIWNRVQSDMESADFYVFLFGFVSIAVIGFQMVLRMRSSRKHGENGGGKKEAGTLDNTIVMISVIMIVMIASILLRSVEESDPTHYEMVLIPSVIIMMALLFVRISSTFFKRKTIKNMLIAVFVMGLILSALSTILLGCQGEYFNIISECTVFGFLFPVLALLSLSSAYRIIRLFKNRPVTEWIRRARPFVILIGILVIITGYSASMSLESVKKETISPGESMEFNDYEIRLENIRMEKEPNKTAYILKVEILKDGDLFERGEIEWVYHSSWDQVLIESFIERSLSRDLYIKVDDMDPDGNNMIDSVRFEAKRIPLMSFVWGGFGIMVIGGLLPAFTKPFEKAGTGKKGGAT